MKKIAFLLCFLFSYISINAQDTYTVNGETFQLKIEVDGKLDLLWNIIDGKYRYFIRTSDNTITELVNTKNDENKYQEDYKATLQISTEGSDLSTKNVNLTLFDLRKFIDTYNSKVDTSYQSTLSKHDIDVRFGVFGGMTNSPFVNDPNNEKTPQFGLEMELLEISKFSRHAFFMQLRHVLENDYNSFSTTEISLGYRFRFVNTEKFSLYGNMTFATVSFSKSTISYLGVGDVLISEKVSETVFDVPFIFGMGADFKITNNSYITLGYNEIFALLIDNQGDFSTNITLGYKFNL
jgi:hypothetical protein